jgi:splicing factor 3B subunit 2
MSTKVAAPAAQAAKPAVEASKASQKAQKPKQKKKKKKTHNVSQKLTAAAAAAATAEPTDEKPGVEIEYVSAAEFDPSDPQFAEFGKIFSAFTKPEDLTKPAAAEGEDGLKPEAAEENGDGAKQEDGPKLDENGQPKPTKKERKHLKRLKVALLKQLVARPEIVDVWSSLFFSLASC